MTDGPSFEDRFRNIPGGKNRPDTPDFWRLAEQASERDRRADIGGQDAWEAEVDKWVDNKSLAYVAMQRAMRVLGIQDAFQLAVKKSEVAKLSAIYYDGFIAGAEFQAAGGHQE